MFSPTETKNTLYYLGYTTVFRQMFYHGEDRDYRRRVIKGLKDIRGAALSRVVVVTSLPEFHPFAVLNNTPDLDGVICTYNDSGIFKDSEDMRQFAEFTPSIVALEADALATQNKIRSSSYLGEMKVEKIIAFGKRPVLPVYAEDFVEKIRSILCKRSAGGCSMAA